MSIADEDAVLSMHVIPKIKSVHPNIRSYCLKSSHRVVVLTDSSSQLDCLQKIILQNKICMYCLTTNHHGIVQFMQLNNCYRAL